MTEDQNPPVVPEPAQVSFVEVATETVHESVEHEREITLADDLDPLASEPYAPVEDITEDITEDVITGDDQPLVDLEGDPAQSQGLVEETAAGPPTGERMVNAITAAVRR